MALLLFIMFVLHGCLAYEKNRSNDFKYSETNTNSLGTRDVSGINKEINDTKRLISDYEKLRTE